MAEKSASKKTKRPTALKREIRNGKRREINKSFKSRVRTSIRNFERALESKKEASEIKENLNLVYSMMDKGVKRGLYKKNKADRTKSRLTIRMQKAAA